MFFPLGVSAGQYRTESCSMNCRHCGDLSITIYPRSIGFGVTELWQIKYVVKWKNKSTAVHC